MALFMRPGVLRISRIGLIRRLAAWKLEMHPNEQSRQGLESAHTEWAGEGHSIVADAVRPRNRKGIRVVGQFRFLDPKMFPGGVLTSKYA